MGLSQNLAQRVVRIKELKLTQVKVPSTAVCWFYTCIPISFSFTSLLEGMGRRSLFAWLKDLVKDLGQHFEGQQTKLAGQIWPTTYFFLNKTFTESQSHSFISLTAFALQLQGWVVIKTECPAKIEIFCIWLFGNMFPSPNLELKKKTTTTTAVSFPHDLPWRDKVLELSLSGEVADPCQKDFLYPEWAAHWHLNFCLSPRINTVPIETKAVFLRIFG